MQTQELPRAATTLGPLLHLERAALMAKWRQQVRRIPRAQALDIPTLNDEIPVLLDELEQALASESDESILEATQSASAPGHGLQRLQNDFDIEEIVAEYNLLRGCIHDLASEHGLVLTGNALHVVNRVLDHAIGVATATFAAARAMEVQQRREHYLAFVAHDLRTPLNAIALAARTLKIMLPEQGPYQPMLRALLRNTGHLETLVNKVLDENCHLQLPLAARAERRRFDLWPLVETLFQDLHPLAQASATELVNEVPEDLVVDADAHMLRRVYENLVANAIKYTPMGRIVVGARLDEDARAVESWVSDNGAGIPEGLRDAIFEVGECDPVHEGAGGLGLAIVKLFVEMHGGSVGMETQSHVGSTFRFSLPLP